MKNIIPFAIFAIAGVGLGGVNVANNATAINGGEIVWNDLTLLVAGLAITGALLSAALASVIRRSLIVGSLMALTVLGCTATSLHYTLHRVGGVSDAGAHTALAHNAQLAHHRREVSRLTGEIEKQQTIAARECRGYRDGKSNPKRWPNCLTARGLVAQWTAQKTSAEAKLAALGAPRVTDPSAERVSQATGGLITPAQYRTLRPLVTAGSLELGCNLLFVVAGMFAPAGGRRQRGSVIEAHAVDITPDPVVEALRLSGAASNRELAQRLGWSEAKTSRAVKRLRHEARVTSHQHGRQKLIALVN